MADRYGLEALMPKARRAPQMPGATSTHVVEELLTLAVLEPTIGHRQYADRLGDRALVIAKSTVQKILAARGVGTHVLRHCGGHHRARGRYSTIGRPFRFLPSHGGPRRVVSVDSFYIGKLKGVGKVYQLPPLMSSSRWVHQEKQARMTTIIHRNHLTLDSRSGRSSRADPGWGRDLAHPLPCGAAARRQPHPAVSSAHTDSAHGR